MVLPTLKELILLIISCLGTIVIYTTYRKQGAEELLAFAMAWLTAGFAALALWLLRKYNLI